MPIYGVDIHPRYQAGISIEQIRREGFDFMAVKVSEGTNASFMAAGSADFLRRGKAAGLLCLGYHYLRAGNEDAQARVFAEQLRAAGVPGMLDAEDGAGDIGNIRAFVEACRDHGVHVPLMYLPRWYWDRIGRPDLSGLPPLWASRYVAGPAGPASAMYERHDARGWQPYGGLGVEVLQFTDRAQVAGRQIDANRYRGSRQEFAALIGTPLAPEDDMTPDQTRMLAEVHHELTQRLPSRSEYAADPPPADTLLGAALNADGRAHEALTELRQLKAALPSMVAEEIRTALARGVLDVDISVHDRTTDTSREL